MGVWLSMSLLPRIFQNWNCEINNFSIFVYLILFFWEQQRWEWDGPSEGCPCFQKWFTLLTHLFPIHLFSTPWKHQKPDDFLFSGGTERVHWHKWLKIILVAPATSTIVRISFSTLKRVKPSILSTRPDHLLMIHIYNNELDEIDIKLIISKFIKVKQSKIATFGLIICLL